MVHGSRNIGSGLLIPWSQLNHNNNISDLKSRSTEGFAYEWVNTREKSDDQIMDVDDCDQQKEKLPKTSCEQANLYECNVEG